jgi:hypothetical protein
MSMVIPGYGLSDTGALCGGVGFDNEEIKYSASLAFKFQECYKDVIDDISDFSSSWTGYNAKWID